MKKVTFFCALVLVVSLLLTLPVFSASAETYVLGDVDGDGEVTSIDATIMQRYIAYFDMSLDYDPAADFPDGFDVDALIRQIAKRGDVDGDGDLTIMDVTLVMRYNVGLKVNYPVGEEREDATEAQTEAPTQPTPTQLVPTQPVPTQPVPTQPVPTQPAPTQLTPTQPTPTQPAPTQPKPTAKPDPYELPAF